MKRSAAASALPLPVRRALVKLGADLSTARRRRRISTTMLAERALIDRKTLRKVERGDPGTSLGVYATVLFVLGMADRLERLMDPATDALGIDLATDDLPKRVRASRRGSR